MIANFQTMGEFRKIMTTKINAGTLKRNIYDAQRGQRELALLDIREHGQYGMGHPFFAVSCPYSLLEAIAPRLVPQNSVPVVFIDDDDGLSERAAQALKQLGYTNLQILDGGAPAWEAAGFTLYQGVNLPSKTFGELVELVYNTPTITAGDLKVMQDRGDNVIILDGRTPEEFQNFNIPGGISCPNAELPLRFDAIVDDPNKTVVINCAGRTRSIIGAQTLIDFGIKNKVVALENGTQGWALFDLELERGADRFAPNIINDDSLASAKLRARVLAEKRSIPFVNIESVRKWQLDLRRTTYVIDVRSSIEFESGHLPGAVHAPGGQLVQATDIYVGVHGARIVVCDDNEVRAIMVVHWLRRMGRDAHVLRGGVGADATEMGSVNPYLSADIAPNLPEISEKQLALSLKNKDVVVIDIRSFQSYREGHIPDAYWVLRANLPHQVAIIKDKDLVVVSDNNLAARLFAREADSLGCRSVCLLSGGLNAWVSAQSDIQRSPDEPADRECKDYLFFTGQRHMGNKKHMRQYLEWEIGLVSQLDADERTSFDL